MNKSSHLSYHYGYKVVSGVADVLVQRVRAAQEIIHKERKVQVCSHQGQKTRRKPHTQTWILLWRPEQFYTDEIKIAEFLNLI